MVGAPTEDEGVEDGDAEEGVAPGHVAITAAEYNAVAVVDQAWTMPRNTDYEGQLCYLMAFAHQRQFPRYPKNTLFTKDQLLELHPQHIHDWLARKAFGKIEFSVENGDRPVHARSSTLEFMKKAVSYFMPDNAPHWCNGHGNPTKHNMHRKLLDVVKKCEVRGQGAESKVKRALTIPEF